MNAAPACWRWKPITNVTIWRLLAWSPETWTRMVKHQQQWSLMYEWHRGRCAVCGRRDRHLVEDHSHETGLTRGFLCQSCNVREGYRWGGVYEKYRERNPASILALRFPYVDPVTGIAAKPKPVLTPEEQEREFQFRLAEIDRAIPRVTPAAADPAA